MSAKVDPRSNDRSIPASIGLTLLDLVWAVNEYTDDPDEIVEAVYRLLDSGRVRLTGNFRDHIARLPN
jgi:hypothetical protein